MSRSHAQGRQRWGNQYLLLNKKIFKLTFTTTKIRFARWKLQRKRRWLRLPKSGYPHWLFQMWLGLRTPQ